MADSAPTLVWEGNTLVWDGASLIWEGSTRVPETMGELFTARQERGFDFTARPDKRVQRRRLTRIR